MLANNPSRFESRALACVVFGVIDDAMGTPTENLEPADIEQRFFDREVLGVQRYLAASPETARRWKEHGITSLAQYYTSKIKYDPDRFALDSAALEALLRERGFLS